MQEPDRPAQQIEQIHAILTRSTTFVSLSGLSGISAGLVAFGAVCQIHRLIGALWLSEDVFAALRGAPEMQRSLAHIFLTTLAAALALAFLFTWRGARRHHHALWNLASRRFALHLALPLLAGGVFVTVLAMYGVYELVCPAMLTFFGLSIINAGKYSYSETVVFGVIELALGLTAAVWVEAGLVLWGLGFGVGIAGYGLIMYLQHGR